MSSRRISIIPAKYTNSCSTIIEIVNKRPLDWLLGKVGIGSSVMSFQLQTVKNRRLKKVKVANTRTQKAETCLTVCLTIGRVACFYHCRRRPVFQKLGRIRYSMPENQTEGGHKFSDL